VESAYNKDYPKGMFTSITTGISEAINGYGETLRGFLLWPVDCPLIPPRVVKTMLEASEKNQESFIVPCYKGKKGHPLFIPKAYFQAILEHNGEEGLKGVTRPYEGDMIRLETNEEAVVLDMDTPESYEEILRYYEKMISGKKEHEESIYYQSLLKGKRLFLVRHGETVQHKEKVFIGQYDVPLSDLGRRQGEEAGDKLLGMGADVNCIYTSDLARARDTSKIISQILAENITREKAHNSLESTPIPIIVEKSLREIALGEWEGQSIREIRARFPDQYEERGQNFLTYKFDNSSENFYDLQYRVMKGFRSILEKEAFEALGSGIEKKKDIILVAHDGVIKVILSNIYGIDLETQLKENIPKGSVIEVNMPQTER
jgi:broad specificity phosphatase PhoE